MRSWASTAPARLATTAKTIAASIETPTSTPPMAAPIGKPEKLRFIETVNARPIQAGGPCNAGGG